MINVKDVIRMKIPYPNISDKLAVCSHMYICKLRQGSHYEYIKCQSIKPYMLSKKTSIHYLDEKPDLSRNPFTKPTRIDCDKVFSTFTVKYDQKLKTNLRSDVSDDLFNVVLDELQIDGYQNITLNENELVSINNLIVKIFP